jgi:hypothetical protein
MPIAPRGGAVRTSGSGNSNDLCARIANTAGVTLGTSLVRRGDDEQITGTPPIACAAAAACPNTPAAEATARVSAHTGGRCGPGEDASADRVDGAAHLVVPANAL